jgi:hypothetical protein
LFVRYAMYEAEPKGKCTLSQTYTVPATGKGFVTVNWRN